MQSQSIPSMNCKHVRQEGRSLPSMCMTCPASSVFFYPFPRCLPPFVSLRPVLLAGPYRLHLLRWKRVMVPKHSMEKISRSPVGSCNSHTQEGHGKERREHRTKQPTGPEAN